MTMTEPPKPTAATTSPGGGAAGVVPRSPSIVSPSMLSIAPKKEKPAVKDFFDSDDSDDAEDDEKGKQKEEPKKTESPPAASHAAPQPLNRRGTTTTNKSFAKPTTFRSPSTVTGPMTSSRQEQEQQPFVSAPPAKSRQSAYDVMRFESDGEDDDEENGMPKNTGTPRTAGGDFYLPRFIPPDDDPPQVNGNTKMRKLIDEFRQQRTTTLQHLRECDDEDTIAFLRRSLAAAKTKFIQDSAKVANGGVVSVDIFELKKQLVDLFSETYKEGDSREKNPELMACLFHTLHLAEMTSTIVSKKWLQDCIAQEMPYFFGVFLSHRSVYDGLSVDLIKSFISLGSKSKTFRVDFTLFMFAMARKSRICYENFSHLQPCWQSAFESVVSVAQIREGESRQNRADLVENALTHPYINIDVNVENPGDKQTIFSRACREGDIALVKYLLQNNLVRNINAVQSDGTNALQQATARNMPNIVLFLCQNYAKQIAKSCVHVLKGRGTALDIAIQTQADRRIENALQTIDITHVGGDHLRSTRNLKAEAAEAAKQKAEAEAAAASAVPKDATQIMRVSIATMKPLLQQLKQIELDHRDDEAKHIQQLIDSNKSSLAQRLEKLGAVLEITADDAREQALDFLDTLILEGDGKPFNGQILAICCRSMETSLSLTSQSIRRLWIHRAVESGSMNYIRSILTMRGMQTYLAPPKYDPVIEDILKYLGCCKILRIDVTRELLKYSDALCLDDRCESLAPIWAKLLLEMIPSMESRKPSEVRTNRMLLVQELCVGSMRTVIKWDIHREVAGLEHSTFSKCCAEGDVEFVQYCFQQGLVSKEQGNKVLSTGLTPLMHAIAKKRESVVKILVQYSPRIIDVLLKTSFGSAVQMAQLSGGPAVGKMLTEAANAARKAGGPQ